MSTRKIIPTTEESVVAVEPNASTARSDSSVRYAPASTHPTALTQLARDSPVDDSTGRPNGLFRDSSFGTASFLAPTSPKRIQRRMTNQRSASMLASIVSSHRVSTKTDLLAKQDKAIELIKPPPTHVTRVERATYRVDQHISTRRGQTVSLTVLGIALIVLGGIVLKAVRPKAGFGETVWQAWSFMADAGVHTAQIDVGIRIVGVLTSLVGILYFSVIMGFVVDGIRAKMDTLKRGKTNVAEENHTLLLGWTDKSISLIRQICLANASENGGVIVVLAELEKEELEAELASQIHKEELRGTKVIFRTGTPLLSVDLLKVSAHRARSIIIMANSSGDADRSDAAVLRTVLSLKTLPELAGHIVAELRDIDNDPLLRLVGGEDVEILVSHDIIGRLVLMSARSPGLARVFSSLLGFEGNEFYFKEWPECVGVPFGGLSERFPNAIPLGIKRKDGDVLIFPNFSELVQQGDQILVLAEDDDTYKACDPVAIEAGKVPPPLVKTLIHERILMCGWRRDIRDMIQLLDAVVHPGTELHMVCEEPVHLRNTLLRDGGLTVEALANLKLVHHYGNTAIRRNIEGLPWATFTSIMILSDQSRETDIMHSDSHSLASLLLIRDLQARSSRRSSVILGTPDYCKCISEILDPRTQRTISTSATILKLSEFIQSNELVSCILAMISESRDVRVILDELLGPEGAQFEVESSARYCEPRELVSFWQLAKRAMLRREILCGFQLRGNDETVLNPPEKNTPRIWGDVDLVVLRSEEDSIARHSPAPVHASDFERTSQNRQMKATYSRQHIIEAIMQESDLGTISESSGGEGGRSTILKAVRSFAAETGGPFRTASATDLGELRSDKVNVRALITAARMLADALEQAQTSSAGNSGDEADEAVTAYTN